LRGEIAADITRQQLRADQGLDKILRIYGIKRSTYYDWQKAPTAVLPKKPIASAASPRPEEIKAVLTYRDLHPDIGYRKFTWQMVDGNIAFLSESKVYDILSEHNRLQGWNRVDNGETAKEYRHKPKHVHYHWHTDIAYVKVGGIFYFLIMMLDGYSRYLLDWELMTDMLGGSVESFVQRVKEKYPHARPRLINDNGSQFISHDFKRLLQKLEIQQIFTRRNHPQTNGKIERMNGSVKQEALRPGQPSDFQEAWEILNKYSYEYNHQRLHAGINFLRPADMFFGRGGLVLNERREKIENARADRKSLNKEDRLKSLH
jgi:transposase InsO family protein